MGGLARRGTAEPTGPQGGLSGPASRVRACDRAKTLVPLATPSFAHRGVCESGRMKVLAISSEEEPASLGPGGWRNLRRSSSGFQLLRYFHPLSCFYFHLGRKVAFLGRPVSILEVRPRKRRGQRLRETEHTHETRFETKFQSAHVLFGEGYKASASDVFFSLALTSSFAIRESADARETHVIAFSSTIGGRSRAVRRCGAGSS